ncbi:hypothetical protein, partial [Methylobacterium segetis]|uniref:hypothetical protein n=1 Tax=Methylobacterium segetis TaxID=2488750 RepID=UPI001A9FC92F
GDGCGGEGAGQKDLHGVLLETLADQPAAAGIVPMIGRETPGSRIAPVSIRPSTGSSDAAIGGCAPIFHNPGLNEPLAMIRRQHPWPYNR